MNDTQKIVHAFRVRVNEMLIELDKAAEQLEGQSFLDAIEEIGSRYGMS